MDAQWIQNAVTILMALVSTGALVLNARSAVKTDEKVKRTDLEKDYERVKAERDLYEQRLEDERIKYEARYQALKEDLAEEIITLVKKGVK